MFPLARPKGSRASEVWPLSLPIHVIMDKALENPLRVNLKIMVLLTFAAVLPWLVIYAPGAAVAGAHNPPPALSNPRALVLHSYHQGFTWTENISAGLESVFTAEAPEVELLYEFMDVKRISSEEYFDELKRLYELKYAGQDLDLIICSDDHALDFILGRGRSLFPGVPAVFCAVNGYDPRKHTGDGRPLTGVVESIDIRATLDLALRLQDDVREVVFITDRSLTGSALKEQAQGLFEQYEKRLKFSFLEHRTMEQLQKDVAALQKGTIVFAFIFSRDELGRIWSHEYNLTRLASACPAPIYSVWEFYLGHGLVGGMLASGFTQGETAARLGMRILRGENASDIPVVLKSPNRYMFDYHYLKLHHIDFARLPENSMVVNRPFSVFREYRFTILAISALMAFLTGSVFFLLINIKKRKNAETALRESEEQYRDIFESAQEGIFQSTPAGRFIRVNPALARMCGYETPAEMIETVTDIAVQYYVNPEDRRRNNQIIGQKGSFENTEFQVKRKDGSKIWVSNSTRGIFDAQGRLEYLEGMVIDITQRKRAEEALRESESAARALINAPDAAAFLVDRDGVCLDANEAFAKSFGKEASDILGRPIWDLFPPDESARKKAYLGQAISKKAQVRCQDFGDGTWKDSIFAPIFNEDGEVARVAVLAFDITERKKTEEQLKISVREKETLLHELHHRVKNNMQVIISLMNLQGNSFDDEKLKTALLESQSRIYAMSAVHAILHQADNLAGVDLARYLSTLSETVLQTYKADGKNIRIATDVAPIEVNLETSYPIGLVLNELVSNAVKYAFPDGRSGEIRVTGRQADANLIKLTVADNGVGLPEGLDWRQADSLGLRIVTALVEEQLGGSIALSNSPGARWDISFPV